MRKKLQPKIGIKNDEDLLNLAISVTPEIRDSILKQLNENKSQSRKRNPENDKCRVNVKFTPEDYSQLESLVGKGNMSGFLRSAALEKMSGVINTNNISFVTVIIRQQVEAVLVPMMERMIALSAKSCIQSTSSALLAAEAISKFVPPEEQEDFQETYIQARKKAVQLTQSKTDTEK